MGKVGLPELVRRRCLVLEFVGRLDDDEGWAGDQVVGLEQAVDRSLGDKIAFGVGEHHREFPWRQFRSVESKVDDPLVHRLGDAVPDPLWSWPAVLQGIDTAFPEPVIPAVEGGAGMPSFSSVHRAGKCDCSTILMISSFSDAGYLIRRRPIRDHAFFQNPQLQRPFGDDLLEIARRLAQQLHLVARGGTRRVAGQPLLAGFEKLLRPVVIQALGDTFTSPQRRDRLLAAQPFQHNADLLLRSILLAGGPADVLDHRSCRALICTGFLSHLRFFERLR